MIGIEPTTPPLRMACSTPELHRRGRRNTAFGVQVQAEPTVTRQFFERSV